MERLPRLPHRIVPRLELGHRAEKGGWTRNVAIEQIMAERVGIEATVDPGELNERLDLRTEYERVRAHGEEQRLLAEGVAREHEPLRFLVPEREGEHAAKPADRLEVPGAEGLDKDFGVGGGAETVAEGKQLFAELDIVIDLAVEDDGVAAVRAPHRLLAAANVDDRQAAMTEPDLKALRRRCRAAL